MAEPYLSELRSIVDRASVRRDEADDISCRHFFGGAAAYANGHIFMTLTPVGLALKLPENDRNALFDLGAEPLRYFPGAPVKKDYATLPSQLILDEDVLDAWIWRSIAFVRR